MSFAELTEDLLGGTGATGSYIFQALAEVSFELFFIEQVRGEGHRHGCGSSGSDLVAEELGDVAVKLHAAGLRLGCELRLNLGLELELDHAEVRIPPGFLQSGAVRTRREYPHLRM
jgi:hypothetical protein